MTHNLKKKNVGNRDSIQNRYLFKYIYLLWRLIEEKRKRKCFPMNVKGLNLIPIDQLPKARKSGF